MLGLLIFLASLVRLFRRESRCRAGYSRLLPNGLCLVSQRNKFTHRRDSFGSPSARITQGTLSATKRPAVVLVTRHYDSATVSKKQIAILSAPSHPPSCRSHLHTVFLREKTPTFPHPNQSHALDCVDSDEFRSLHHSPRHRAGLNKLLIRCGTRSLHTSKCQIEPSQ